MDLFACDDGLLDVLAKNPSKRVCLTRLFDFMPELGSTTSSPLDAGFV